MTPGGKNKQFNTYTDNPKKEFQNSSRSYHSIFSHEKYLAGAGGIHVECRSAEVENTSGALYGGIQCISDPHGGCSTTLDVNICCLAFQIFHHDVTGAIQGYVLLVTIPDRITTLPVLISSTSRYLAIKPSRVMVPVLISTHSR